MSFLTWSDEYCVNVKEIDEQHKKLFDLLNRLNTALIEGRDKEVVYDVIKNLAGYTIYHFSTEEKYMLGFNFPGYRDHKSEHEMFIQRVLDFQEKYELGIATLSIEVMAFLSGWVAGHIEGTDRQFGPFFNERGLN